MKNLLKGGIIAFAFSLIFISVETANAQYRGRNREARREYREDVRDARQDYRRRANQGNYRKARREYREDIRDARRDYRQDTRSRWNRGRTDNYWNRGRYNKSRYYRSNRYYNRYGSGSLYETRRTRVYYRNGRRYVVRY